MLKRKKQFSRPKKPWQLSRIKEENQLAKEYGLRNKKELWRAAELLKNWRELAKQTVSLAAEKQEQESKILLAKLQKYGIVATEAGIDDVLALTIKNILEKRLQTLVYKKSMALTPKQARQFITHNKVTVNGEKVSSPAYLVKLSDKISFIPSFKPNLVSPAKAQELKEDLAEIKKVKAEMKEKAETAVEVVK